MNRMQRGLLLGVAMCNPALGVALAMADGGPDGPDDGLPIWCSLLILAVAAGLTVWVLRS